MGAPLVEVIYLMMMLSKRDKRVTHCYKRDKRVTHCCKRDKMVLHCYKRGKMVLHCYKKMVLYTVDKRGRMVLHCCKRMVLHCCKRGRMVLLHHIGRSHSEYLSTQPSHSLRAFLKSAVCF